MKDADQLIAGALRDIANEAGLPGPIADAAWRAGGAGTGPGWPYRQHPSPARSRSRWPLCCR